MLKYDSNLSWQDFAANTIATNDLDPVYVALYRSGMPEDMLMRWCAAFVAYYHMGTASQICHLKGEEFWIALWTRYDSAPRSGNRRHFRGESGKKALRAWANTYSTPEKFFAACMQPSFMKLLQKSIPQIGLYFTWKCMDLREAVFGYHVDWTDAEHNLVNAPKQGLEVIFPELKLQSKPDYASSLLKVVDAISHIKAPPRSTRACGVAEAETICCGLKQYYVNKVPTGEDIVEKRTNLVGYGEIADHILSFMPEEPFDVAQISA